MEKTSKTGKRLDEINVEAVKAGKISPEDIKISAEVLNIQKETALKAGRTQLAGNFSRAAEMVDIPDDVILRMYNQLRPNRSTKQELLNLAGELRTKYRAEKCAALVLDAAEQYEKRGILL